MNSDNPVPVAAIAWYWILRILTAFPIACFSGALATDIAYAATADMLWADFSAWLLAAGMVVAVPAGIAWLIDLAVNRRFRLWRLAWAAVIGGLLVLILGLFDNLVHSRDAWTSVVPLGLGLSAVIVVVMLITVWLALAAAWQPRIGRPYPGANR